MSTPRRKLPTRTARAVLLGVVTLLVVPSAGWAAAPAPGLAAYDPLAGKGSAAGSAAGSGGRTAPATAPTAELATGPVFADEFSGAAGRRPSSRRWTYNGGNGTSGWGNHELQYYTSEAANARLDGRGHLAITARKTPSGTSLRCWYGACRYTSARMMTLDRFSTRYGRVEARIKVPRGVGLWPALWSLDVNNVKLARDPAYAEIDVLEHVGDDPTHIYSSLHGRTPTASRSRCTQYTLASGAAFHRAFHVYTLDWDSSKITFSVDGHPFVTRTRTSFGPAWTFDQQMFLVLNLAVGGDWPGSPTSATRFPATMLVDYVRVYARAGSAVAAKAPAPARYPGGCDIARGR